MQEKFEEHEFPREDDLGLSGIGTPPQQQQADSVGIIRELSPLKVLKSIKELLNGKVINEKTGEYEQMHKPLLNEYGIGEIMAILSASMNDVVTMSNFDRERADKLINLTMKNAIFTMYIYHEDWGIKKDNLLILENIIMNTTCGAFGKSVGAGERAIIRGVVSENILQRNPNMPLPEQKKSWWQRSNPFNK